MDPVNFASPEIRSAVAKLRRAGRDGESELELFDEALALADLWDSDSRLFSAVDLALLDNAAQRYIYENKGHKTNWLRSRWALGMPTTSLPEDVAALHEIMRAQQNGSDLRVQAQPIASPPYAHRKLLSLGHLQTKAWGRISMDGRFYAIGTRERGVIVFDLQRSTQVRFEFGHWDPNFTDDRLLFHGTDGSGLYAVDLDFLRNDPPALVRGTIPGAVVAWGGFANYQDTPLSGRFTVSSSHYGEDLAPSFETPGILTDQDALLRIQRPADWHEVMNEEFIATPGVAGFQIGPAGMLVGRLADTSGVRQSGYAIYQLEEKSEASEAGPLQSRHFRLIPIREVLGLTGGKAKVMDGLVAFHHAVKKTDTAYYGSGADSNGSISTEELARQGSADIFVYNVVDNTAHRITDMGPGRMAWYPNFMRVNGRAAIVYLQRNADGTQDVMVAERIGLAPRPTRPPTGKTPKPESVQEPAPLIEVATSRWSSEQRQDFRVLVAQYLQEHPNLVDHHAAWHRVHVPRRLRQRGGGQALVSMHRRMLADLERWLSEQGRDDLVPIDPWQPSQITPVEFPDAMRRSNSPEIEIPSWLTLHGESHPDPLFGHVRLDQFRSPDEIGRAIVSGDPNKLGYHGGGHLFVGGLMGSRRAPQDPLFWLWHRHLDGIIEVWLQTVRGQQWLASDDGRRWSRELEGRPVQRPEVLSRLAELLNLRRSDPQRYEQIMRAGLVNSTR